ncbi:MAG: ferritin family protein [Hydrogenoanaerobacterium sp.]
MNLKGKKSEANVKAAFAGESQARNKYTYYAEKARAEGLDETADLFLKMADNEKEHAKIWFKIMNGINDTDENVQDAANGENGEWQSMYPSFAKEAREEGLEMLAQMFEKVAGIEKTHEERFLKEFIKLKNSDENDSELTERTVYRCAFCGYIHEIDGKAPPAVCPLCEAIGAFEKVVI